MKYFLTACFFFCAVTQMVSAGGCAGGCDDTQCCSGIPPYGAFCRNLAAEGEKCQVEDTTSFLFGYTIGPCACAEGLDCIPSDKKENQGTCQLPPAPVVPAEEPAEEPASDADDTKVAEPVADDTPAEESAADDTIVEESAADDTPAEESSADDTPAEESAADDTPAEESAADDTPAEESAADDTPAEESAADDTPAEESAADDTPAEEPAAEAGDSSASDAAAAAE